MNQSLSDETHDVETDVPDRILQMRRLKKRPRDDGRTYLGADPRLFYIQGCFMAEYEDHYAEYYEPLFDSQPTYEALSIKQLRCYFTWRAAIRSRRASGTGIYYIYLYLFELINNIGVAGSLEALERMAFVINTYRNIFAGSVPLFKTWFRDYYALNNVDKPFSELVRGLGLSDVFPVETYEDEFEYIYTLRIGDFDITGDPFIADFGFLGFARCYNAVMKNLKLLFNMYGFDIDSLFKGAFNTDNTWFPYDRAIFCDTAVSNDRVLRFSAHEQYVCVRNVWNRRVMSYDPASVSVVSLIIKKMVRALSRQPADYSGAPSDPRFTPYMAVIGDRYFDEIIASTAARCLSGTYDGRILPVALELENPYQSAAVKAIWRARSIPAASRADVEITRQFVSQARMLADCVDDYDSAEPLPAPSSVKCTYSMLDLPLSRMYLTWRARYKAHKQTDVNPLFAKIHANELINKIGAETDMEVLEKLADLIKYAPDLSETFLDFFVTRQVETPFSQLIRQLDVPAYFPNIAIQSGDFEDWYGLFADKTMLRKSAFFSERTGSILAGAFNRAIKKLRELFENAGLTFIILFLKMDEDRRAHWKPFSGAVCLADYSSVTTNKYMNISDYDSYAYYFAYRKWQCESASAIDNSSLYLISYIIKRLTFHLHKLKNFKKSSLSLPCIQSSKIKQMFPSADSYAGYISMIKSDDFNNAIDSAFTEFTAPKPIKIRVDTALLDMARKSADKNLERLIADYGEESAEKSDAQPEIITETGWGAFISALNGVQLRALSAAANERAGELTALARSEGVMAEVLVESINNAALAHIGDYIIEDTGEGQRIFEEYRSVLEGMISGNG